MNQDWIIELVGVSLILIGWFVKGLGNKLDKVNDKLESINKNLLNFVQKTDCQTDMTEHCKRLDDLNSKVDEIKADVIRLKEKHNNNDGEKQ